MGLVLFIDCLNRMTLPNCSDVTSSSTSPIPWDDIDDGLDSVVDLRRFPVPNGKLNPISMDSTSVFDLAEFMNTYSSVRADNPFVFRRLDVNNLGEEECADAGKSSTGIGEFPFPTITRTLTFLHKFVQV